MSISLKRRAMLATDRWSAKLLILNHIGTRPCLPKAPSLRPSQLAI